MVPAVANPTVRRGQAERLRVRAAIGPIRLSAQLGQAEQAAQRPA
jgi:hypothetical protein